MDNVFDEIKQRCDIVDYINNVVKLKKAGQNYSGLCPFHNEKTPSFVVFPNSQTYKCFGCNESGDVINFVSKYYNIEISDAVERLATEHNIEFKLDSKASQKFKMLYECNSNAAKIYYKYFHSLSEESKPRIYMKNREVSEETLKTFKIGYAPESWDFLKNNMADRFKEKDLVSLSLLSQKNQKTFDKFRDRIMFPIQDIRDRFIGFGGRVLGDGEPKYLNSNESQIFQKKDNLYGLNIAKNYVREVGYLILVEGYMDVISLYDRGFKVAVASLGTSLTREQCQLIKRHTDNVYISYDSDSAGVRATLRAIKLLIEEGINIKVIDLGEFKDPDDFIKGLGEKAYSEAIENSLEYVDFVFNIISKRYDLSDNKQRYSYVDDIANFLKDLDSAYVDINMKDFSQKTGIKEGLLRTKLEKLKGVGVNNRTEKKEVSDIKISNSEIQLIKLILLNNSFFDKIREYEYVFKSQMGLTIWLKIKSLMDRELAVEFSNLTEDLNEGDINFLKISFNKVLLSNNLEDILEETLNRLEIQKLELELKELNNMILANDNSDEEFINKLFEDLEKKRKKIQKLEGKIS